MWRVCSLGRVRRLLYYLPAVTIASGIYVSSSISDFGPMEDTFVFDQDKIIHVVVFALLGIAVLWGLCKGFSEIPPWSTMLLAALLASFYGGVDEIHQSFVPQRFASWKDLLADAAGSLMGPFTAWWFIRHRRSRAESGKPLRKPL